MAVPVSIAPTPILQFFNNFGQPNVGGTILTQVGGVNYPVYQDQGVTPLPNPIPLNSRGEVSNAAGASCQLFLQTGVVYTFTVFDVNGNQLNQATYVSSGLTGTEIGQLIWPQSAAELAANVTPTNYDFPWGWGQRYGADPTGVADSTGAINAALSCNSLVYLIAGTYICAGALIMQSGQTLYGDGSATILQYANAGLNNIVMSSLTKSVVRDLAISVTGLTGAHVAGVYLGQCTECTVERVEMYGLLSFGVWIDCSNYCQIENNYFHGFGDGTTSDYGDISIYCQASTTAGATGNKILNNVCYGGMNEFGIAIEDPYNATSASGFATYTLVQGNKVGPHTGYGILHYMPGSLTSPPPGCDTYNTIIANDVQGITGAIASNPSSGAGIYSVGNGSGALIVSNNTVWNCCISTGNSELAPAAIAINEVPAGVTRPIVSGNVINDMTQGHGIIVTTDGTKPGWGGAVIVGNTINMPSTNTGGGNDITKLASPGNGITITNCTGSTVIGQNDVQVYGSGAAIGVLGSGANCTYITISGGNYLTGGTGGALVALGSGGFNVNRLTVTGANFTCTGTPDAIALTAVIIADISSCIAAAASGRALYLNGSTQIRVAGGGNMQSSGSTAIGTSGLCTGSFIDKSVYFGGASGKVSNAGTGCIIEWYVSGSTVPTTGTWALGDHAIPIASSVGNPKGWYTTVAGTPGTQTSEGNL